MLLFDQLKDFLLLFRRIMCKILCRRIVGLAGPPGAGKSTLASEVAWRVNKLWPQKASSFDSQVGPPDIAAVLPMDGFHLYRHQLDAMEVGLPQNFYFIFIFWFSTLTSIPKHCFTLWAFPSL